MGKAARRASASPKSRNGRRLVVREGSKLERIVGLLTQPGGCTRQQVMDATGWPSVSLQQQARAAGLKLKIAKVGGIKYYSAA